MSDKKITQGKDENKSYGKRAERIVENLEQSLPQAIQLRLWPESMRAAPNAVLRSALFAVVKPGSRKAFKEELLAIWKGLELRYTGWQLDQADLDIWEQALHLARECLGHKVVVNERRFLRGIGRAEGGQNIKWLRSAFDRMQACGINLDFGDYVYQGSLIEKFVQDKRTGRYILIINPELAELFEKGFTQIELDKRKQLKTSLAKWLQGYICSHRASVNKPHQIGIVKLRDLCGSERKDIRFFRRNVKKAMYELQKTGVVIDWQLVSDGSVLEFYRPKLIK